ncbi:MAG: HPF/RaiA family ribosome-associated protein [Flavisolibacter sp.]
MKIIIQTINFRISSALKSFINEKIAKLYRQNETIENASVTLRKEDERRNANRSCEIRLAIQGNDPLVKKNSKVYEKSISQAVQALQKILRRKKSKQLAKRHFS